MATSNHIDTTDLKILRALQRDGRLSNADIADTVALSPSPCLRRLRRLEEDGVITGYRPQLDRRAIGLGMTVFVQVKLQDHGAASVEGFEQALMEMPAVINASTVSGSADYLLEVVVADLADYDVWVRVMQALAMVREIESNFALRAVKSEAPLPLPRLLR
ncbi:Lrp/AsnC family transcriptional regulator [Marinobacterium sedimentorum]|uniref:Lrp/AsnC family transcriptional regulator n=1 Tax=Marinobacterium sedimentorum TaxID=2927804 RepID=UPI0020C6D597|nr:Lrp/AsnC family transcriptional regulator [Marinobacterium sedimentorum]MCP8687348.1 Lrp/AsnC family transcriptional regulator [Marinobacterium sedimentorum]